MTEWKGKGSTQRPCDAEKFAAGYDRIFGKATPPSMLEDEAKAALYPTEKRMGRCDLTGKDYLASELEQEDS